MNEAFFDPNDHTLVISARLQDVTLGEEGDDQVMIMVENLTGGIEVVHDDDRLWKLA